MDHSVCDQQEEAVVLFARFDGFLRARDYLLQDRREVSRAIEFYELESVSVGEKYAGQFSDFFSSGIAVSGAREAVGGIRNPVLREVQLGPKPINRHHLVSVVVKKDFSDRPDHLLVGVEVVCVVHIDVMETRRVVREFVGSCEVDADKQSDVDTAFKVINKVIVDIC